MQAQIIGGQPASILNFPYHVEVLRKKVINGRIEHIQWCGGSIVADWKIITAAHCVNHNDEIMVRAGSANANSVAITRTIHQHLKIIHPNFNLSTAENDVALLLLDDPLPINKKNIDTINLPEKRHELKDGTMLTVSGFGGTEYTKDSRNVKFSKSLQYLEIPVVEFDKCSKEYAIRTNGKLTVTDAMFCAGYYNDNKKCTFNGDSGGKFCLHLDSNTML